MTSSGGTVGSAAHALRRGNVERRAWVAAGALLLLLYLSDAATGWTGDRVHGFLRDWFVVGLSGVAASSCLVRAVRQQADRCAWLLLGAGIAADAVGTAVFLLADAEPSVLEPPVASEVLWLAFYAVTLAAVVLLVVPRAAKVPIALWVEAVGAGIALAAVVAAVTLPGVQHPLRSSRSVSIGFAFPCVAVVLVALMLWVLSLARWRHRSWVLLTIGFALLTLGNTALAIRGADNVFVRGELSSTSLPLGLLAIGLAALSPTPPAFGEPVVSVRLLLMPATVFGATVVLLGVYVAHPFSRVAAALAVVALALGIVRALVVASQVRELYESRRYARGFQDASLGMALVDWELRWIRVNPALCQMLRCSPEDLLGHSVLEVTHEGDRMPVEEERARGLTTPARSNFEKRYVRSDGAAVNVQITTSMIEDDTLGTYFYTQIQDVTDRRRIEQRQALVADLGFRALDAVDVGAYLQHVVEAMTEALDVVQCALLTRADGGERLEYVANTGRRIEPYPSASMAGWLLGQQRAIVSNDLDADDRFRVRREPTRAHLKRGIGVPVHAQQQHVLIVLASSERDPFDNDDAHFLEAVANILTSVLDRAVTDRELRRLALVDSLTGLANRATLDQHLATTLATADRAGGTVAVLLLDLDNFKFVNDTLGHPVGDRLLRQVGDRLRRHLRDEDLLARLGGDEFVIVCAVTSGEPSLPHLADRLLASLEMPFVVDGNELHLDASVGIAVHGPQSTAADLLRDADVAMYRAKSRPGSGYELFDADLRQRILARVERERELRDALGCEDQLQLYYQPIVDLQTGAIRGFESLVRWAHPRDGLLSPDSFLPVAEESGLIVPLGEHLLEQACARLARWTHLGADSHYVSFNLSARQLSPDIPRRIERCLRQWGLSPGQLVVEVTEHVLLNPHVAVPILRELRAMGVAVALDDFGTGYSSLSYLETYPLDAIKLDRGFVARAGRPRSAAILRAAVDMGMALGLDIIAEGIETEQQRQLLQSLGCPKGQGYLFARPLPAAEADALLIRDRGAGVVSGPARC